MPITQEDVSKAVEALRSQGKPVSIRAIREYLGTGSMTTIHKYMPDNNVTLEQFKTLEQKIESLEQSTCNILEQIACTLEQFRALEQQVESLMQAACNTVTVSDTETIKEAVKQAYSELGSKPTAIAEHLNNQGVKTVRGCEWTMSSVDTFARKHGLK